VAHAREFLFLRFVHLTGHSSIGQPRVLLLLAFAPQSGPILCVYTHVLAGLLSLDLQNEFILS